MCTGGRGEAARPQTPLLRFRWALPLGDGAAVVDLDERDALRIAAARYGGVLLRRDAEAAGVARRRLRTLLDGGELVAVRHGVYADPTLVHRCGGDVRARHALRVAAALRVRRTPAAAVKHSAVCVHGLEVLGDVPDRPLLVRPAARGAGGRTEAGTRVLRAGRPGWRITDVGGVPVTDLARTVVDIARTWPFDDAVVVADSALRIYGGIYGAGLTAALADVAVRCESWPGGGRRVSQVLAAADPRSESVLETVGRLRMVGDGLPRPASQCWVGETGPEFRTDFGYENLATVGEADGRSKYVSQAVLWDQAKRHDRLLDLGFEVVRFGAAVSRRPGELGARFARAFDRALARRGAPRGRFWADPPWWRPGVPPRWLTDLGAGAAWWLWEPPGPPPDDVR